MTDNPLKTLEAYLDSLEDKSRTNLLPSLLTAQKLMHCISEEASLLIARKLSIPPIQVFGMIDFYSLLHREPQPDTVVQVCTSPVCSQKGSRKLLEALKKKEDTGILKVESVQCLGLCTNPPSMLVNETQVCHVQPHNLDEALQGKGASTVNSSYSDNPVLTEKFGKINPLSLQEYIDHKGFSGLSTALQMDREKIVDKVKSSGLLGRGGAAFPTGIKEESSARDGKSQVYIICNADESEPGTFKDRVLLHEDPFSVLEGMIIAAYAVGSSKGYIYIRGEYTKTHKDMAIVLDEAKKAGFLGENIAGSGFQFDVEIRSGAGAYICGEETALFESIEGKKGYPRNKPPYPVNYGVFGQPTDINNVETFSYISHIMAGKENSGTRLFCLSGDVKRPGLYELPFGTPLDELINKWGGGMRKDLAIGSIILGGASGSFVPEKLWSIPLDNKSLKEAGLSMGSGVIMVFDEKKNPLSILRDITGFFDHESCGKCYPCRMGTKFQNDIVQRLFTGSYDKEDPEKLYDIGMTMKEASLCGLGQTAASVVLSALKIYPHLFRAGE